MVFPVLREWGFEFLVIWGWKNIFSVTGNEQFNNAVLGMDILDFL
jgi:hypothetical protein